MNEGENWIYVDGIKKLVMSNQRTINLENERFDLRMCDVCHMNLGIGSEAIHKYMVADCMGEDDRDFSVYFNNLAFLLNNEGKTIDKFEVQVTE